MTLKQKCNKQPIYYNLAVDSCNKTLGAEAKNATVALAVTAKSVPQEDAFWPGTDVYPVWAKFSVVDVGYSGVTRTSDETCTSGNRKHHVQHITISVQI